MKRSISLPITAVVLICLALGVYYSKYNISGSNGSIEWYIKNKGHVNYERISIEKQVDIEDARMVVFESDGKTLNCELFKKGLIGNYRFVHSTSSAGTYRSFIEEIHNKNYLISVGYNNDNNSYIKSEIKPMTMASDDSVETYNESFDIKNEEYYVKYKVISDDSDKKFYVSKYSLGD